MSTFVLVHGAWHGGWCWSGVIAELARQGHRSVAPDLPCHDPAAGWGDYADVALGAIAGIEGEVVLVGHSLGGGVLPIVAARRPVTRMVFLCSFPPEPSKSLDETLADEPNLTDPQALAFRDAQDEKGRYVWPTFETARYAMYADCTDAAAHKAFAKLRPQAARPFAERWPLDEWPETPLTFIVCRADRMGRAEPLRSVARRRFGVDAIELEGSHSPFLSRPRELVHALLVHS